MAWQKDIQNDTCNPPGCFYFILELYICPFWYRSACCDVTNLYSNPVNPHVSHLVFDTLGLGEHGTFSGIIHKMCL